MHTFIILVAALAAVLLLRASVLLSATTRPTTMPMFSGSLSGTASAPEERLSLWYREPAKVWTDALPVGNGRQGAMMFGGIDREILCLNEGTLWAGGPYDPNNPEALAAMPEVRRLIFDGKFIDAQKLISQHVMAKPLSQMPYQPVGDVMLNFPAISAVKNYRRELNLRDALASVQFTDADGVTYRRELFASAPDNVLVLRLSADRPGRINFALSLRTDQRRDDGNGASDDTLVLSGTNRDSRGVHAALKFQCRTKVLHDGGAVAAGDNELAIRDANSAVILIALATSYRSFNDVGGDPQALTSETIAHAASKNYDTLRRDHVQDHQRLFNRVALNLGDDAPASSVPTDERIRQFAQSNDPGLVSLYFQYGRYLLIASSRAGGQPATLQGMWNDLTNPPWGSKYTININTEMNYWPAGNTNLGECVEPLTTMVEDLAVTGSRTAKSMYGASGWVAHHNTDGWRATAPIDGPLWGMWPTGGAWLCNTLWDHYEFTQDRAFLKRLYPSMKGAAQFFVDALVEEPTHHWLVTCPSISPENSHHAGANICAGPTMDNQILRDLLAHCIEASQTLDVDAEFREKLTTIRARLAPNQIGASGQLQEWLEDWDAQAPEPHHRHVSHLYGLYPGEDIGFYNDKALADAVRKSLEQRGDDATGWGLAWRVNLWARLHDGAHAYKVLQNLLKPARQEQTYREGSGVYNNLFDAHPPFQIDGNFGGSAGIAEMLMQSTAPRTPDAPTRIELLPALPPVWKSGSVKGLCARGGYVVDFSWQDGTVRDVAIHNISGNGAAQLMYGGQTQEVSVGRGNTWSK